MMRIGGKVKLHIVISASGSVSLAQAITGNPILVGAAMEAVKKWTYKPFEKNGRATAVATDVELEFPGGMSEDESAVRNRFFPIENECRLLLNSGKYGDAEKKCREAVEISNHLPKEIILERSIPRSLLAHSIFLQGRTAEALPIYEEALMLDKGFLKSNDADLASDYANMARAYAMSGELGKADGFYATAISTFEAAIQNLPQMKENYTRRLKRTILEYSEVKGAQLQTEAAEQLRKKAASL